MARDRTSTVDLDAERRARRARWAALEINRLELLERLQVLDRSDVDRRIVELQDEIAKLKAS